MPQTCWYSECARETFRGLLCFLGPVVYSALLQASTRVGSAHGGRLGSEVFSPRVGCQSDLKSGIPLLENDRHMELERDAGLFVCAMHANVFASACARISCPFVCPSLCVSVSCLSVSLSASISARAQPQPIQKSRDSPSLLTQSQKHPWIPGARLT